MNPICSAHGGANQLLDQIFLVPRSRSLSSEFAERASKKVRRDRWARRECRYTSRYAWRARRSRPDTILPTFWTPSERTRKRTRNENDSTTTHFLICARSTGANSVVGSNRSRSSSSFSFSPLTNEIFGRAVTDLMEVERSRRCTRGRAFSSAARPGSRRTFLGEFRLNGGKGMSRRPVFPGTPVAQIPAKKLWRVRPRALRWAFQP
jgi:hypothetical protein